MDIDDTIEVKEMAKNAAKAISVSHSKVGQFNKSNPIDIFIISFYMEILTGIPKEHCFEIIVKAGKEIIK